MEIYKTKKDYIKSKNIHIQTANKRQDRGFLLKLTTDGSKVGYIDTLDIVKDFINKLR